MLLDLHVKNLALIEKAEITLDDGLNILTGQGQKHESRLSHRFRRTLLWVERRRGISSGREQSTAYIRTGLFRE